MQKFVLIFVQIALCVFGVKYSQVKGKFNVDQSIVNENVQRSIDLSSSIVRERRAIAITTTKDQELKFPLEYVISAELFHQSHENCSLSYIAVKEKDSTESLPTTLISTENKNLRIVLNYKVVLKNKVKKPVIVVDLAYLHAQSPFPREIEQNEKQLVLWYGNAYMPSVYSSLKQKVRITLPSSQVESYSNDASLSPTEKNGKQLTYGPYEQSVSAQDSFQPIKVHFVNNAAFLTVTNVVREYWISHLGNNLAVHEQNYIKHDGALLKNTFSRIDFATSQMQHHQTQVVKSLKFELPSLASDVYYKDDVGNVSTSNFKSPAKYSSKPALLELRPRYPLYGGWVYTWFYGYNVPLDDFVSVIDGQYVFQAEFLNGILNAAYDNATVKIVLPEGAYDYKVVLPFPIDKQWQDKTFTYVDTIGRPTICLHKQLLSDEHFKNIQVVYKFDMSSYLRKPLVLIAAVFGVFVASMVYWRTEFKLSD